MQSGEYLCYMPGTNRDGCIERGIIMLKPSPQKTGTEPKPCRIFTVTEEQLDNILASLLGISLIEPYNPDDTTDYPIPDGEAIIQEIRTKQELKTTVDVIVGIFEREKADAFWSTMEVIEILKNPGKIPEKKRW